MPNLNQFPLCKTEDWPAQTVRLRAKKPAISSRMVKNEGNPVIISAKLAPLF